MGGPLYMLFKINDITAAQTPQFEDPFKHVLPMFDVIIEIGFLYGGMSIWLNQNKKPDTELYCYDIENRVQSIPDKINFIIGDCFDDHVMDDIKSKIQIGRALILCDGGNKIKEFKTFAQYLKPGDVIMAHDYAHTINDFVAIAIKQYWDGGAEIYHYDIMDAITENALIPFQYNEFKSVFWGSFEKS